MVLNNKLKVLILGILVSNNNAFALDMLKSGLPNGIYELHLGGFDSLLCHKTDDSVVVSPIPLASRVLTVLEKEVTPLFDFDNGQELRRPSKRMFFPPKDDFDTESSLAKAKVSYDMDTQRVITNIFSDKTRFSSEVRCMLGCGKHIARGLFLVHMQASHKEKLDQFDAIHARNSNN